MKEIEAERDRDRDRVRETERERQRETETEREGDGCGNIAEGREGEDNVIVASSLHPTPVRKVILI